MKTKFAIRTAGALLSLMWVAGAQAETLVDPTRPAFAAPSKQTASQPVMESRVSAIFLSGDRRVAVFDGRVVKAGDRVGDAVIQEVLADGVRYARGGRVEVARLPKQAAAVRGMTRQHQIAQESNP